MGVYTKPGRFIPNTSWIGGLVGPTAGLNVPCGDTFELSGPFGIVPNSSVFHPVASQYTDLRYPDTQTCIPNKHSKKLSLILTSGIKRSRFYVIC